MNNSLANDYGITEQAKNGKHEDLTPSERAWQRAKDQAVEEARKTPYDLRRQAWCCTQKLNAFARLLFCRLTDMAFEPDFKRGDGMVECSKKFLADQYGCSVDRITRATRALESTGFLWTKTFWNGAFEITRWFIREWADDQAEFPFHTGANFGRRRCGVQRNTVRGSGGKFAANPESMRSKLRDLLAHGGLSDRDAATVKAIISPDHGQESARTGQGSSPGQGLKQHPDHGQESALTGKKSKPGQGRKFSPDRAEESARTGQKIQPGQGRESPGLGNLRDGEVPLEEDSLERSTVVNAQSGLGRKGKSPLREKTFLLDVEAMVTKWGGKKQASIEMSGSGAWWRLAYRANPSLMERVLADTLGAVKESRIKVNPGAHAVDLWKRWGGSLPERKAA